MTNQCANCGLPVESRVVDEEGHHYCSDGCRTVYTTLGGEPADRTETNHTVPDQANTDRVFFDVDGMHSVTDESYLEAVAQGFDRVGDATASYVTETVRVTCDPDALDVDALESALSSLGYDASRRELSDSDDQRRNELEEMLGFQYIAGVVFGSFFLLPYVVVFYPAQLPSVFGPRVSPFAGGADATTAALLLPFFLFVGGVVILFTGLPLLRGAYASLVVRRPNTDLLVAATILSAYLAGTVALLLGQVEMYFDLAIVVAAVVVGAIFYESQLKREARDRLSDLTVSQVDTARRCRPDDIVPVPVDELEAGDHVLVRQGERVPVDGTLTGAACTVDEAVVTGESLPRRKEEGDPLVGGSVVTEHAALLRVGDPPSSSIERLTTAVWNLQSTTHGRQRQTDSVAGYVAPAVALLAIAVTAVVALQSGSLTRAILAGLTATFVASPWVLGLSTPLSVATSLRAALRRGIVVFDETLFERIRESDVVVFDKTGTLTTGEMTVVDWTGPPALFDAVADLEQYASHPVADAITDAFDGTHGMDVDSGHVENFRRHATGVQGTVDGDDVLAGTLSVFDDQGWTVDESIEEVVAAAHSAGQLPVVAGRNGMAEGVVRVGDQPRGGWDTALSRLSHRGLDVVVLTGDDPSATERYRSSPDVDHVFAGVPPSGKQATIERLQADNHVTMVGDGTNDAPALATADLAISLGSGTALASEAADLTIVDDDVGTVETAFELAEAARTRFRQNTLLAASYNVGAVGLVLAGALNPLTAMGAVIVGAGLVGVSANRDLLEE